MTCLDQLTRFNDESLALKLQLAEIEAQRKLQTGKWPQHNPPDLVIAFDDFAGELQRALHLVEDLKIAHSIARAVDTDAAVISVLRAEEEQAITDRGFALS